MSDRGFIYDPFDPRETRHITQLLIYDFDGTLVLTPEPDTGREHYEKATGTQWPFSGWWGRPESLRHPLVMAPGPALPAFSAAWGVPGAHLVMMTGRRELLRPEVKSVLQQFQIFADYEILNDTRLDTFSYKAQTLRRMCGALPCLEEVVIWEDRPEHSARFCELSASWPHLRWRVITVHPSQPHVVDAFNGAPSDESIVRLDAWSSDGAALPRFSGSEGYERLCLAVPPEAAAVPAEWVRAKEARDGPAEAHVTLLNRQEVKDLLFRLQGRGFRPADAKARLRAAVRHVPLTLRLGSVGMAASGGNVAVFLTASWPEANAFRAALGLRPSDFHVTLGFMGKDVHNVPKDESTHLRNPAGPGAAWDPAELSAAIARRAEELLEAERGVPPVGGGGGGGGGAGGSESPGGWESPEAVSDRASPYGTPTRMPAEALDPSTPLGVLCANLARGRGAGTVEELEASAATTVTVFTNVSAAAAPAAASNRQRVEDEAGAAEKNSVGGNRGATVKGNDQRPANTAGQQREVGELASKMEKTAL